jgi:hypothetical protein
MWRNIEYPPQIKLDAKAAQGKAIAQTAML